MKLNKALDRTQESEGKLVTFGTETSKYDGKVMLAFEKWREVIKE